MSRPFKHPKTGVYWLRKRVPVDLIKLVGKREELLSLRTKDAKEAKERHLAALADIETRWANLRAGATVISERDALEIARELYDRWITDYRDEPSQQKQWRTHEFGRLWTPLNAEERARPLSSVDDDIVARMMMERLARTSADELIKSRGLRVNDAGHIKLTRAAATVIQKACLALEAQAAGAHLWENEAKVAARRSEAVPAEKTGPSLTFDEALKLWIAEKQPRERTIYEWRRTMDELAALIGHRDAHRLTSDDLLRWKAALLAAERSPKTIRDAKIAPVRAILQVAVDNRKLTANPAEKITITVKKVAAEARRGFTEIEAALVLGAAIKETNPVLRWVPWICAYSGARVSEACQLRREDIHLYEGIWVMRFAAEAGPLKNANSERSLPLHPALIEAGFLRFAESVKPGPLFAELPPDTFGKRGGNGTKILGRWVRALGLTDARLAPNHSWRHRFKTLGRRYDLRLDIVDAITGHAPKSVGDAYGAYPLSAMLRELEKIPTLAIDRT